MEVSLKQFVQDVTASGLLSPEDLSALQKELPAADRPADAAELAKKLVRVGKLTRYQAANAVQGRAKNLVFGEYVVLDKIGAGGMGQVFKAEHRRMKRIVALKIVPPSPGRPRRPLPKQPRLCQACTTSKVISACKAFRAKCAIATS